MTNSQKSTLKALVSMGGRKTVNSPTYIADMARLSWKHKIVHEDYVRTKESIRHKEILDAIKNNLK